MKLAYADPPYLGCCSLYGHYHPDGLCWDNPQTHRLLIERLGRDFPDGWALSLHTPSLEEMLHICREVMGPNQVRTGSWVKPWASFKPGVNPGYCWEPVIFYGGRKLGRDEDTVRDWVAANVTLKKGLTGAKPLKVCYWIFKMLGAQPGDEFTDLFPGTGIVGQAWDNFNRKSQTHNMPMFASVPTMTPAPAGEKG